jgi:hypothetical protein
MPNDNSACHQMLTLLGLMTVSVSLIVISFGVALSHKTHKMVQEAMVPQYGTNQRAFRAAACHIVQCTGVTTVWKTRRQTTFEALTVTETKLVYADRPITPTTELEVSHILTLMPHTIPTGKVDGTEKIRAQIFDINKPEMQM